MNLLELWPSGWAGLLNHLWQSTAIAFLAWVLTLALRRNRASIRYAIWMFASAKFLIPFSLLVTLGSYVARPAIVQRSGPRGFVTFERFTESIALVPIENGNPAALMRPASPSQLMPKLLEMAWLCGCFVMLGIWIVRWMRAARTIRSAASIHDGRELDALRRVETDEHALTSIPLVLSSHAIEPGVFGILHPVLLWPAGLSERLDDAQIEAIMAHEIAHVRRHDNLTAAVHALVEAIFWFHPAVRWMSSRMMEERERACDEKVLEQNARPHAYAESILKVCAFCIEPALPCVSGVSGSDLKKRILRIMTAPPAMALNRGPRIALAIAAGFVFLVPLGIGVVHGQPVLVSKAGLAIELESPTSLPKYDIATIKPATSTDGRVMMMYSPDGVSIHGVPMRMIVQQAFGVEDDRIMGEPGWVKSNRYDIEAKVEPENAPKLKDLKAEQRSAMLLPLLEERCNLKYHIEKREMPTYSLVVAKGGSKMKESKPDNNPKPDDHPPELVTARPGGAPPPDKMRQRSLTGLMMRPGHIESQRASLDALVHMLSRQLGRTVIDNTGLTGTYDYTLDFTPENMPMPMGGGPEGGPAKGEFTENAAGPSIFTALQEQLGLKLEATKSMVDVVVIDHMDLPSQN